MLFMCVNGAGCDCEHMKALADAKTALDGC